MAPPPPHPADGDAARAASDALRRQVDFLETVASDPDAPRPERLRAIELLAEIAGRGAGGGHAASKGAAKQAAKHAAKHAGKHAAKHASKHAAKTASKHASKQASKQAVQLGSGSPPRRLTSPATPRALPSGS